MVFKMILIRQPIRWALYLTNRKTSLYKYTPEFFELLELMALSSILFLLSGAPLSLSLCSLAPPSGENAFLVVIMTSEWLKPPDGFQNSRLWPQDICLSSFVSKNEWNFVSSSPVRKKGSTKIAKKKTISTTFYGSMHFLSWGHLP